MGSQQLHVPTMVVAGLVVAALANLAEYPSIERDAGDWYRALRVKEGHELVELGDNHFTSTQARFAIYLDLREFAYGADVAVAEGLVLNDEQLRGLGGASSIELGVADLAVTAAVAAALEGRVVATGEDQRLGTYVVVTDGAAPPARVVVAPGPDRVWVVDRDLLEAVRAEVGA